MWEHAAHIRHSPRRRNEQHVLAGGRHQASHTWGRLMHRSLGAQPGCPTACGTRYAAKEAACHHAQACTTSSAITTTYSRAPHNLSNVVNAVRQLRNLLAPRQACRNVALHRCHRCRVTRRQAGAGRLLGSAISSQSSAHSTEAVQQDRHEAQAAYRNQTGEQAESHRPGTAGTRSATVVGGECWLTGTAVPTASQAACKLSQPGRLTMQARYCSATIVPAATHESMSSSGWWGSAVHASCRQSQVLDASLRDSDVNFGHVHAC